MHHVRQQLAVHLAHLGPVSAVHVRHVEIVALVAPAFVEDLFELFLRLEIHAQRVVQTSGAGLRRRSIRIDEVQLRRWRIRAKADRSTTLTTATTSRAINDLAMIRADLVSHNVVDERHRTTIAKTIPLQLITLLTALSTATAAGSGSTCFEIKHLTINTGLKITVWPLRHARNRNYPLSQTVKIDLHRHWRTWTTWTSAAFTSTATTFARTTGVTRTCARLQPARACSNTTILMTLRQQWTRIRLTQNREVKSEIGLVIVRSHVEPLRAQTRSEER